MKANIAKYLVVILTVSFGLGAKASPDAISSNDAFKLSKSTNTIIVSTRKATDYKTVHINGAVHIDLSKMYKDGPVKSMLKSSNEIAAYLGQQGITEKSTILLYDDGSGKYAGRAYWILRYLGAPNVKVINGGMKAWRAARKPVTKNPTSVKAVTFTPKVNAGVLSKQAEVQKAIGNGSYVILDVRSAEEYKGTAETKLRPGHIPGSKNLDYKQVMDARGNLKSAEQLQALFSELGISKDKTVILYCESSVRAGIVFLALHSALEFPKVKVYDGAYLEWQSVSSNKVES